MFKKFVLFISVFGFACVAYFAYQWMFGDPAPLVRTQTAGANRPIRKLIDTQPASQPAAAFEYRGAEIQPGDGAMVRVFNQDGEARIVFQAAKWRPVSDTEFHVTQPTARVLLPGGQLAYVRSDEGQIVVQRDDKNNYNPKRGKLSGHVQLFIDRTKPEWRKANPDLAEPQDHPEAVVKIWMDDVSFDLDLARLETDGPIKVQSVDATVEGRGLTLIWNELNRRVKLLRIAEGKHAIVHMKSLVQLGIAREEEAAGSQATPGAPGQAPPPVAVAAPEPADAAPAEPEHSADKDEIPTITLSDLEDAEELPKSDRIDTYQIIFRDGIVAEQRQGLRVVGSIKAEMLEILRDFGSQERSAVEHAPTTKPAGAAAQANAQQKQAEASASTQPTGAVAKKDSTLELRWSGELVVTPVTSTETQPATGNRFQVVAQGNPVQLHDRETGDASCSRLEYRDETQEVWLIGDRDHLVTLQADANRKLAGERVFLDRKNGVARVEGPGQMTDVGAPDGDKGWPECIKNELAKHAKPNAAGSKKKDDGDDQVLVTWTDGVEIRFGISGKPQAPADKAPGLGKGKEFLKSAQFRGNVSFVQPGQSMAADQIDITFAEPKAQPVKGERAIAAEAIIAQGHVRMGNDQSDILCDRLEVDMTTDDVGRNVPQSGRAFGNVVARQGKQEIRAADQMVVTLESVPKTIPAVERERFEAAAKACGYTTESAEWKAVEEKLRSRREVVVRTLNARGNVAVLDPQEKVDVGADALDCTFDDQQQISRAFVIGSKQSPAHVGMSDFYVRGEQVNFRVTDQTAEVPGEGILRFFTKQDLSGGRTDEAVPVVVTWKNGMSFRGNANTGLFTGSVRAVSAGTILDCRELSLRFENVPEDKPASQPADGGPDSRWIAGKVIDMLSDRPEHKSQTSAAGISRGLRKRLTHIHAIGDAVIASSEHEKPRAKFGPFSAIMSGIMPDAVQQQPEAQPVSQEDQRLLSFVRINGPRITVDLNNEHLVVEGAGNLLVLDYHLPTARPKAKPEANGIGASMAGSLQSGGPSQTVFTWQNSMSYLNRRNVAVLDNRVVMKHAAGSEVAMPDQVAAAMKVDPKALAALKSRRAELTCENLVVEFERGKDRSASGPSSLSSAAELKSFQASHRVRMQENNRSVEGEVVTYDSGTALVRIAGSPQLPARISDMNEKTGAVPVSWRGQELEWNLDTGVVTIQGGSSIMAPGR